MGMRTFLFVSVCLLLTAVSLSAQANQPNPCPTHITACGCVITTADIYEVDNDLNINQASNSRNCIEIRASHAVLNLKGFSVEGDGGIGIGILIRRGADHAVVQGGD